MGEKEHFLVERHWVIHIDPVWEEEGNCEAIFME